MNGRSENIYRIWEPPLLLTDPGQIFCNETIPRLVFPMIEVDLSVDDNRSNKSEEMAATRATKSGIAAEAQMKINSKYNEQHAHEVLEWIAEITGNNLNTSGDMDNFYETLKDGTILCNLVNHFKAGMVKKINTSTMAFKCMENINNFLRSAGELGVPTPEQFQTVDLWERQNLTSVVICLQSLARKAPNFGLPGFGPKEATKNVRNFSEEQLKASEGIISLQYGSNQGANQSGINFGNTRHM